MRICLSSDNLPHLEWVNDWLTYHAIAHDHFEQWQQDQHRFCWPQHIEQSVIVTHYQALIDSLEASDSLRELVACAKRDNQIWIMGTPDIARNFLSHTSALAKLDQVVPTASLVLWLDAHPLTTSALTGFAKITTRILPANQYMAVAPRYRPPSSGHHHAVRHAFMITDIGHDTRPHCQFLWHALHDRVPVMEQALVVKNPESHGAGWMGQARYQQQTQQCEPSASSAMTCGLEIVAEQHAEHLHCFTSKSQNPLMLGMPFLTLSTPGYLGYLHDLGFHTFHDLIDEGYDHHERMQDRVHHMIMVLQDIITNGVDDFKRTSQPTVQHNFNRLCEIVGSWRYRVDQELWQALDQHRLTKK